MCCPATGLKVKPTFLISSLTSDFPDSNLSFGDVREELLLVWLKEH